MTTVHRISIALALALLAAACARGPEQVLWGVEECAHCQMMISDDRFAGQIMDARGRTWKFDAVECMPAFLAEFDGGEYAAWVSDGPSGWTPVDEAYFVHSPRVHSPMGGGLIAATDRGMAEQIARDVEGVILDWAGVLARPAMSDHGHAHGDHGGGD